ncbi:anti sigma factor C-terminal domain-containing protein [Rummeliibacillus pycnus]|uniref:anti sigma factor C-terminal domain-containing protein n=1 Tax=Rummeliibacillus pycnus TaxID=101070 RepID=UPI0037C9A5A7
MKESLNHTDILLKAKSKAKWNTIISILSTLLLIGPVMFLLSLTYYSIGDRANKQILTLETIYSLTDPTMTINDNKVRSSISPFFGLTIDAPIKQQYNSTEYNVGSHEVTYRFGNVISQKQNLNIPKETSATFPQTIINEDLDDSTNGLDKDSTVNAFVVFKNSIEYGKVSQFLNEYNAKSIWNAVETGKEKQALSDKTRGITLIGFPSNNRAPENSGFIDKSTPVQLFYEQLAFISSNSDMVDELIWPISLEIKERRNYIKDNGLKLYGATLSIKVKDLDAMIEDEKISGMKVITPEMR